VSSLSCARAREMLYQTWDKNDRKDTKVILYLLSSGISKPFYDPLINQTMDIQELSNTYHQVTIARTRCLNSLVNHNLTLYFPEAEQFLHAFRSEWFCEFLLKFPTPNSITRYKKATFVRRAWTVIGRKQYKQQFLEHIYDIAASSIGLPVDLTSVAVETYKLQLNRYIEFTRQRLVLEKQSEAFLADRADYQRLRTLSGVGAIIAFIIIAESGDLNRFNHYRVLLGISKKGDRYPRCLLVQGSKTVVSRAKGKDDKLSRWINRIVETRGHNRACVAYANKMSRMAWAVMTSGENHITS